MPSKRVLIVEDDEASQYIFSTVLRHYGFEVLQAWGPDEAMQMLHDLMPDVVVMDVGLPVTDGFELTRRIKSDPATAHIPVVVVTVHIFDSDRRRAQEVGCDLFLGKPAEPRELARALQQLLGIEDGVSTSP